MVRRRAVDEGAGEGDDEGVEGVVEEVVEVVVEEATEEEATEEEATEEEEGVDEDGVVNMAVPKSQILIATPRGPAQDPALTMMLSGLMSRCTMPAPCMVARAAQICRASSGAKRMEASLRSQSLGWGWGVCVCV